jgi:hypothetical protein
VCQKWTGAVDGGGYGSFWFQGRAVQAHRFAYVLEYGPTLGRLWVVQTCGERLCCNLRHLIEREPGGPAGDINRAKVRCPQGHEYDRWRARKHGRRSRVCSKCAAVSRASRTATAT